MTPQQPDKRKTKAEAQEQRALFIEGRELFRQDDHQAALRHFSKMLERWPEDGAALLFVGGAYNALEQYGLAVPYLKKAVALKPSEEIASRTLFYSLWKAGNGAAAYRELERFVMEQGRYSDEYDLLLQDMRGEVTYEEYWQRSDEIEKKNGRDPIPRE